MFDIRKLLAKDTLVRTHAPGSDAGALEEGLEVEYQRLITAQFSRMGIGSNCVTVDVRRFTHGPHGYDVLIGMVRMHRWEREAGLRMLLGLPLIESRVRKLVRSTWLADYSQFAGLWLHASEHLHESPGAEELRELLLALTPPQVTDTADPCAMHPFSHSGEPARPPSSPAPGPGA